MNKQLRDLKSICEDYKYNPSILSEDEEKVAKVKFIVDTKLSQAEKNIILSYADCQSYRLLSKKMGISHMTLRTQVVHIKKKILDEYSKL